MNNKNFRHTLIAIAAGSLLAGASLVSAQAPEQPTVPPTNTTTAPSTALTEAQVRAYCKENLTGYKQPKVVEFRTELPKTPVGKILRRELRDK